MKQEGHDTRSPKPLDLRASNAFEDFLPCLFHDSLLMRLVVLFHDRWWVPRGLWRSESYCCKYGYCQYGGVGWWRGRVLNKTQCHGPSSCCCCFCCLERRKTTVERAARPFVLCCFTFSLLFSPVKWDIPGTWNHVIKELRNPCVDRNKSAYQRHFILRDKRLCPPPTQLGFKRPSASFNQRKVQSWIKMFLTQWLA